jgi:hypothetical protein
LQNIFADIEKFEYLFTEQGSTVVVEKRTGKLNTRSKAKKAQTVLEATNCRRSK